MSQRSDQYLVLKCVFTFLPRFFHSYKVGFYPKLKGGTVFKALQPKSTYTITPQDGMSFKIRVVFLLLQQQRSKIITRVFWLKPYPINCNFVRKQGLMSAKNWTGTYFKPHFIQILTKNTAHRIISCTSLECLRTLEVEITFSTFFPQHVDIVNPFPSF